MDLSGRGPAYRGAIARCPGCGEPMRCEAIPSAAIDVCDACEGLWVDWFDGEVQTLAVEVEAARPSRPGAPRRTEASGDDATKRCPRCALLLRLELHRFTDARAGELVDGVELFRCPECAGSFVPRPSVRLFLDRAREPPTTTFREAFLAVLKRLVGAR